MFRFFLSIANFFRSLASLASLIEGILSGLQQQGEYEKQVIVLLSEIRSVLISGKSVRIPDNVNDKQQGRHAHVE